MTATAKLDISLATSLAGSNAFSAGPFWSAVMSLTQSFASGTTANKIDIVYMAERTVATATNDDIDLAGVLADALGTTITAAELVGIFIVNEQLDGTDNTTNLTIGGGTNPFTGIWGATGDTIGPVTPGGCFLIMNPNAAGLGTVTASTGDILRIANSSGATNKYKIAILARSA